MIGEIQPLEGIIYNKISLPDRYEHNKSSFMTPDVKYAISKDSKGNIVSHYGDDSWDFYPYRSNPTQHCVLKFSKNIKKDLHKNEAKKFMFLLMVYGEGKKSSSYSIETLRAYFSKVIAPLALYSISKNRTITMLLSNNKMIKAYIDKHCINHDRITLFSSFLTFIDKLDNGITGITFKRDPEIFKYLLILAKEKKNTTKQTEIIPTRILSESIRQRWLQVQEVEDNINGIVSYLRQHMESDLYGETQELHDRRIKRNEEYGITFEDAASEHNLKELFSKYNVSKRHDFGDFLRKIQGTCKHLIHAYTGMRDGEVQSLQTDCLDKTNNTFLRLVSHSTKFAGTRKKETWVTDKDIERIIKVLTVINNSVAQHYKYSLNGMPLFIRTSLFYANKQKEDFVNLNAIRFQENQQLPLDMISIKITEKDIQELYDVDYMRDWRNEEKFQVGKEWYFQFHQYRRSLAVYSIQSGLVSLGALQKQFKHTFRDMSIYYASGATFGKSHISRVINKIRPELNALSYIKNVIFSDEELFGAQGMLVEKNTKESNLNKKTYLLENREKTEKRFRNGLMSYKETPLGGCISTEACNASLTRSFIPCIGCDSGILKISKMDNVIAKQKNFIALLDKTSVVYRTEMEDLKELKKQRLKLEGKSND